MKQQILWVVEFQNWRRTQWSVGEACFTRKEARESMAECRRAGMQTRIVKYIRSE